MAPTAKVTTVAVACAVTAAAVVARLGYGSGVAWWALPLLAVAVIAFEVAVVHIAFGRQRWTFSLTEAALAAAFVLRPGGWIPIAAAIGITVALLLRRQSGLKFAYNIAQFTLGAAAGALVAQTVGGVSGGIAGMAVFWLVNNLLIAYAVAVMSGQLLRRLLWESAPFTAVHSAGTASLGLLGAWLSLHAPMGLAALLIPMLVLWFSYDEQTARSAEARLFAELARLQEQAAGRSLDLSAQVVLTAAARLFGGADVEMVLVGPDGPLSFCGDESGIDRRRVDPDAFSSPWVLRTLGSGRILTGHEDGRPFCSTVLGPLDSPNAVLIARRPKGAPAFGRRETNLAGVLAGQAESWLSVAGLAASAAEAVEKAEAAEGAARALGDLGAHTAPSLAMLRDSTARLARLAAGGAGQVGQIVDELHAVERAVASLLGAIALAADPELARLGSANPVEVSVAAPAISAEHWTTTGVLSEPAG
ncbi:MAG: hypothetical protein ACYCO3_15040 [Mycobacteriales bacterium]